jgi:threonine/homoserine/homoserine lactone efflux protein
MTPEILSALVLFAFATSVTPGPNNLMLMASGANYGFRRTVPHMLGISLGHLFMVVVLGLGLAQVFTTWPVAHHVLKVLSVAYMLYLAWRIATAAPPGEAQATGRPFTFVEAAAFQWVNPKAWAMALTAISVYAPGQTVAAVLIVAAAFAAVNLPSVSVWTALGTQAAPLADDRARGSAGSTSRWRGSWSCRSGRCSGPDRLPYAIHTDPYASQTSDSVPLPRLRRVL